MKKVIFSFLLMAGVVAPAFTQTTLHDPNAEKRSVSNFHGIEVATGIKLVLTSGNSEEVVVSASTTEFRDKIITEVIDGILKIHYETKWGAINKKHENKNLKAYVSYKELDKLNANTGAEVKIEGILKAKYLSMKVNTGAIVSGTVEINELQADQNTGSIITLNGKADKLEVEGDTGSIFKGLELHTSDCTATAGTGAGIYITVQKELNAKANTGGFIKYKGAGGIREIKTNTGGSISKI